MKSLTKAIRLPIELWAKLNIMRNDPKTYQNDNERRSVPTVIRKLLHDSQELAKIEQSAMSSIDNSLESSKSLKSHPTKKQKILKNLTNSIILFCFDCQVQTPQRKLKSGEWKCSQCGSKRNV